MAYCFSSPSIGSNFNVARISMAVWGDWVSYFSDYRRTRDIRFCWNNVCIYDWKVGFHQTKNIFPSCLNSINTLIIDKYYCVAFLTTVSYFFRYLAICHPLKTSWHSGKSQTIVIILVIWILSLILSLVWICFTTVSHR